MLERLGSNIKGGNHLTLKRRLKHEGIDYSLLKLNFATTTKGKTLIHKQKTKEEFLKCCVENSNKSSMAIKAYIIRFNIFPYLCKECGNEGEYNGKKLALQLHHINEINTDNRLENLCLVCPNCHSQIHGVKEKIKSPKKPLSIFDPRFGPKEKRRKTVWPSKEELERLVLEFANNESCRKIWGFR